METIDPFAYRVSKDQNSAYHNGKQWIAVDPDRDQDLVNQLNTICSESALIELDRGAHYPDVWGALVEFAVDALYVTDISDKSKRIRRSN